MNSSGSRHPLPAMECDERVGGVPTRRGDHAILGLTWHDLRRIQLTAAKRLLSSITELPMRVAARSELHAKVIRQDRVVLHELGKWGLIGSPETDPHLALERHGR